MSDDTLFDLDALVDEDDGEFPDYLGDLPMWLIGCGRPATRGPRPMNPFRTVVELPPLDAYQPAGGEVA